MKPIFVITLPADSITQEQKMHFSRSLTPLQEDYHVIFMQGDEIKCQLFSVEGATVTDIDEIKQLLKL